ncbi:FtsX-like permease family protein [Micromonospora pattaloongensis]|nr:FtsX-like permease family protein [Micromonospora pattaloongensis]
MTAGTLVAVMPGVLHGRAEVMNARMPSPPVENGHANFAFSTSTDVWDGQRLGRTFLADVRSSTVTAPGVTRLPNAGEVVVSPALAARLPHEPDLAVLVPGRVVGTVQPAGLLSPDELFAYVGVERDRMADAHNGASFGSRDSLALEKQQAGLTQSLALLVLPPVVIYLVVCGRLAAATRLRRYAALRLLGMRRGLVLRTAFLESSVAGLIGGFIGIVLFRLAHPALASSGLLGFSWYPDKSGFTPVSIGFLTVFVGIASGFVGAAGLRRSLDRPIDARKDTSEVRPRPWLLLPLVFGLGSTTYLLLAVRRPAGAGVHYAMPGTMTWVAIGSVVITVLGVLVSLKPILAAVAQMMARPSFPLPVRMAGARLALQTGVTLRLLVGLALLVLVAGVSAGVLRDLELRSSPSGTNYSVDIEGSSAPNPVVRQEVFELPARFRWTVQSSVLPEPGAVQTTDVVEQAKVSGYRLVSMSCSGLRKLFRQAYPDCRDGRWYRMASRSIANTAYEVPAGAAFNYDRGDGTQQSVTVPAERLVVPDDSPFPVQAYGGLFYAHEGPAWAWTTDSYSSFLIDPDPAELSRFKVRVAALSPATQVRVWGEDLDLLELARNQRGVIGFGVLIGFLVAILAFGIATVDNAVERRRDVAVLLVVGMRKRLIRLTQIMQLLAALVVVLLVAAAAGYLAGNVALRLNDVNRPWYAGTLDAMMPLAGASVIVAVCAGSFVAVRRLRSEDLKRE